ncbi:MAG: hypothetical protein P4M12_10050 [Gammaproteobacteria bacterium]|nr:hypothetical protein [Gammaproteobacteria bacterium]
MDTRKIDFTSAFYTIPPQVITLGFDGPSSAEDMINFFNSPQGETYRENIHNLFIQLRGWIRDNFRDQLAPEQPLIPYNEEEQLDYPVLEDNRLAQIVNHFEKRFHDAPGDVDSRAAKFGLFTKGIAALQKIMAILEPDTEIMQERAAANKERHLALMQELIETIDVCSSGAEKKILDIAGVITEDLDEYLYSIRMQLANQLAKETFLKNSYIQRSYYGNEIHHINYLLDLASEVIRLRLSLDPLAGMSEDNRLLDTIESLTPALIEKFVDSFNFDYVMNQLLIRTGFHNLYEGLNYSNSAKKLLHLARGLEFIGIDKRLDKKLQNDTSIFFHYDVHETLKKDLDLDEEIAELTTLKNILISKVDMEIQVRISILKRLEVKNILVLNYSKIESHDYTLYKLENANLLYSFIILKENNKRIPFIIYLRNLIETDQCKLFSQISLSDEHMSDFISYLENKDISILKEMLCQIDVNNLNIPNLIKQISTNNLSLTTIIKLLASYSDTDRHQFFSQRQNIYEIYLKHKNVAAVDYMMRFMPFSYFSEFINSIDSTDISFIMEHIDNASLNKLIKNAKPGKIDLIRVLPTIIPQINKLDDDSKDRISNAILMMHNENSCLSKIPFQQWQPWLERASHKQIFFKKIKKINQLETNSLTLLINNFLMQNFAYQHGLNVNYYTFTTDDFEYLYDTARKVSIHPEFLLDLLCKEWSDDFELYDIALETIKAFLNNMGPNLLSNDAANNVVYMLAHTKLSEDELFDLSKIKFNSELTYLDIWMKSTKENFFLLVKRFSKQTYDALFRKNPKLFSDYSDEFYFYIKHRIVNLYENHPHSLTKFMTRLANSIGDQIIINVIKELLNDDDLSTFRIDLFKALPQNPVRLKFYLTYLINYGTPYSSLNELLTECAGKNFKLDLIPAVNIIDIKLTPELVEKCNPFSILLLYFGQRQVADNDLINQIKPIATDSNMLDVWEHLNNKYDFDMKVVLRTMRLNPQIITFILALRNKHNITLLKKLLEKSTNTTLLSQLFKSIQPNDLISFLCTEIIVDNKPKTLCAHLISLFDLSPFSITLKGCEKLSELIDSILESPKHLNSTDIAYINSIDNLILTDGSDAQIIKYFSLRLASKALQPSTLSIAKQACNYDNHLKLKPLLHQALINCTHEMTEVIADPKHYDLTALFILSKNITLKDVNHIDLLNHASKIFFINPVKIDSDSYHALLNEYRKLLADSSYNTNPNKKLLVPNYIKLLFLSLDNNISCSYNEKIVAELLSIYSSQFIFRDSEEYNLRAARFIFGNLYKFNPGTVKFHLQLNAFMYLSHSDGISESKKYLCELLHISSGSDNYSLECAFDKKIQELKFIIKLHQFFDLVKEYQQKSYWCNKSKFTSLLIELTPIVISEYTQKELCREFLTEHSSNEFIRYQPLLDAYYALKHQMDEMNHMDPGLSLRKSGNKKLSTI